MYMYECMFLFIYFFSGLYSLSFKERWHRVGWEDLGEVENFLVSVHSPKATRVRNVFGLMCYLDRFFPVSTHCFSSLQLTCHLLTQIPLPQCTILNFELGCGSKLC